jgi:pheromone shutdown-related protein TraB
VVLGDLQGTPVPPAARVEVQRGGCTVVVLGTAHVSRESAREVETLIDTGGFDAVAIELCENRHKAIVDPEAIARLDLFQVVRDGKLPMVAANLALGAFQQRIADEFGIEPGADMRAAIAATARHGRPLHLIDREIGVTLRRIYRSFSWWRRYTLFSGLLASVLVDVEVTEEEIERLKGGDLLESTFAQFATSMPELYGPLIDERDRYMAAWLEELAATSPYGRILAVVGAGHVQGIARYLGEGTPAPLAIREELDTVPPGSWWPQTLPWIIVAFILAGFVWGFRRDVNLGWHLVVEWILYTGGLSALGTVLARGHLLTILTAFLGAPLTTLHPALGVGMFTGLVEAYVRKPTVGDFAALRKQTVHWRGWFENPVARTIVVFFLSSLGAALGLYLAGFLMYQQLLAA